MKIKRYLKALLSIGAKTVVAGLQVGGGPVGGVVADILADHLGFDKNDPKFEARVLRATQTAHGRTAILMAEKQIIARRNELFSQYELRLIDERIANFSQVQQTARAELKTGDSFITRTRPLIARWTFGLSVFMLVSMMVALITDGIVDNWLLDECFKFGLEDSKKDLKTCLDFVEDRQSYAIKISIMYKDNWLWLAPIFSILPAYFTGRTIERRYNVQAKD